MYDLLNELREDQKKTNQSITINSLKFSEHLVSHQEMHDEIKNLKRILDNNNTILDKLTDTVIKHENRSTNLEKIVLGIDDKTGLVNRVSLLEEPGKVKTFIYSKALKISMLSSFIVGIITGVTKILGLW